MFFIFGIQEKEKELRTFSQVVCPVCGQYSQAVLFVRYTCFHIFFIPTFRWNRHYYVKLRCCGALYEADAEYGKQLESSDSVDFSRLKLVTSGFGAFYGDQGADTRCPSCGRSFDSSFAFCPHCGTKRP